MPHREKPPVALAYQRLDFIPINPQGKQSGEERELQLATIRSHAGSTRTSRLPRKARSCSSATTRSPLRLAAGERHEKNKIAAQRPADALLHDSLQGEVDPFNILGSVGLPDYALQVLDFVTEMPFKPRGTCTLKIFVIRTLKDFAYGEITSTQARLVLHAALSNSLWHLQFQLPDKIRLIDNLYLRHQLAAVGLLRQDLHEHPEPPTLSSLFSVLALACHGGRINRTNCNHENPLSPLAYAQDLHIYGRAEQTAEHVTGSIILARKMGGLTHIQDPYLIYGVETGDVFQASSELRPPKLDCRHSIHLPLLLRYSGDSAANTLRSILGRSLTEMLFLTPKLQSVIQAMCDATILLDQYYRDMLDDAHDEATLDATFQVLANVRIGTQHALLTLTPEKNTEETPSAALMYHACWLTLLIYSDIVLFVTPVQSGIRGRQASELLRCLTLVRERDPGHCNDFYAWAAVVGGIAASTSGSAHLREAYTRLIQRFCGPFLRCRIDAILERCTQYMWWGVVLDQPARAMLLEVTKDTYQ